MCANQTGDFVKQTNQRSAISAGSFRSYLGAVITSLIGLAAFTPAAVHAQTVQFESAQLGTIGSGLADPNDVAVDGHGNVYIADTVNSRALKETLSGGVYIQTVVGSGFLDPLGVAVDASGNIYIADSNHGRIVKEAPSGDSYTQTVAVPSVGQDVSPSKVAVDGNGDLYVAGNAPGIYKETLSSNGYIESNIPISARLPTGLAVDSAGNIYAVSSGSAFLVKETPSGGGYTETDVPIGNGSRTYYGIAVDGSGNLYLTDLYHAVVVKETVSGDSYTETTVATGGNPTGIAVDANGNVYVAEPGSNQVVKDATGSINFGPINVCQPGQSAPSPCGNTITLNYNVTASGTLGTPNVLTMGAPNLDFTLASGSTCTGTVTAGSTCTVNVTFTPRVAGVRNGAVQIVDNSGNLLATTYLNGTGNAPQIAYNSASPITLGGGFSSPVGVAVDGNGDVFVADAYNNTVKEMVAVNGSIPADPTITAYGGFIFPTGMAIDGSGNIYVADTENNAIKEIPAGCTSGGCIIWLGGGFNQPFGVAVDGDGNVYVADSGNGAVKEMPPGCTSSSCVTTLGTDFDTPYGLAVDAQGNMYVADTYYNVIKVMPAGCASDSCVYNLALGFDYPYDVKVDGNGNLYVSDTENEAIKEVPVGCTSSSCVITLTGGFHGPQASAVDANGNLYVGDTYNNRVVEIPRAQAPALNFASTPLYSTSSDSPQSLSIQNIGNAPLTLSGLSVANNFAQVTGSGALEDCSATTSLAPAAECNLSISFTPQAVGSISGSVALSDNALNGNPAIQTIALAGMGQQGVQTITFTGLPATATYGAAGPYTLSATASSGLAVSYSVTGPATLSGSVLTITGQGTVVVTASQTGDSNYNAAASASQTITVSQATASVTLGGLSQTFTGSALSATATTTPAGLAVNLTYNGSSTAPTAAGSYAVVATINSPSYQGSTTGTLVIAKATPAIAWTAPSAIVYGTALSKTQLNATSTVQGTFAYSPGSGSVLNAGNQTLSATLTPNDATDYASTTASVTLAVNAASQSITFNSISAQTVGASVSLSATASSGLAVSFASTTPTVCTVSGTTATMLAAGTCSIQATQSGNSNYSAASSVTDSFAVATASGFKLSATPGSETIKRGNLGAFLLEVTSVNGFSGNVKIACSGGPSNSICGNFPQTVKVNANATALALSGVLFPTSTAAGTYTINFTGTSGSLTSSTSATFTVK